jgi:hypothetical protein
LISKGTSEIPKALLLQTGLTLAWTSMRRLSQRGFINERKSREFGSGISGDDTYSNSIARAPIFVERDACLMSSIRCEGLDVNYLCLTLLYMLERADSEHMRSCIRGWVS